MGTDNQSELHARGTPRQGTRRSFNTKWDAELPDTLRSSPSDLSLHRLLHLLARTTLYPATAHPRHNNFIVTLLLIPALIDPVKNSPSSHRSLETKQVNILARVFPIRVKPINS